MSGKTLSGKKHSEERHPISFELTRLVSQLSS